VEACLEALGILADLEVVPFQEAWTLEVEGLEVDEEASSNYALEVLQIKEAIQIHLNETLVQVPWAL